ncbi:hypothetical protein KQI63_03490 [bacterium]|nr:hypothetical protein [bacterium]
MSRQLRKRGVANRPGFTRSVRLALLLLVLVVWGPSLFARQQVEVNEGFATVDLGEWSRGDHFQKTLRFFLPGGEPLQPVESETTCDCVTTSIDGLDLVVDFEVEPEEPDGRVEKTVYLFTDHPDALLIRLTLVIEVAPGGQQPSGERVDRENDSTERETARSEASDALVVLFFHSPGCQSCRNVKDYTLPHLEDTWGERIVIRSIDIDDPSGFGQLLAVRAHYGIKETRSPFLFAVGSKAFGGEEELADRLDRAIQKALDEGVDTWQPEVMDQGAGKAQARHVFRSFSFWAVVGAGLLDGLNPCAFATLVFFVGLLSYAGSTRRQIVIVGTGFTASVFVVYLLLGVGAFRALEALAVYGVVARVIYILTLVLLGILFFLSLRDLIQYWRTGETRDQVLQLSRGTKRRIHGVMKRGLKTNNLLLGAIGIGILITLFEAACTGQVYLPTIVLMLKDPVLQGNAIGYLLLYNLLFILPLVIVFFLTYAGVSSGTFASWSKQHYGLTRLLLTLLFLALALLMVFEMPGL